MQDINFLPDEYRRQRRGRTGRRSRVLAVALFVALAAAASFGQYRSLGRLRAELDALEPQRQSVIRQKSDLARLQGQLDEACAQAELITYLRHPWPRTRLLDAIAAPLTEEIVLQEIGVRSADPARIAPTSQTTPSGAPQAAAALADVQALELLRKQCDAKETVITLTGTTADSAALQSYLATLGKSPLFQKAAIGSIETQKSEQGEQLRFQATVLVRPGFGQPDGPTAEELGVRSSELGVANREAAVRSDEGSGFRVQNTTATDARPPSFPSHSPTPNS